MNTTKKFNLSITLLIAAMFFLTTNLSAQKRQEQGPPPIPNETQINKMVEDLSTELSLSEKQKAEFLSLYTDHFAEVKELIKSQRKSKEEMESKKAEFEDEIKNLLSDKQQDLFDDFMEKNNKQKGKEKPRRN
jgi:hypothetical protein